MSSRTLSVFALLAVLTFAWATAPAIAAKDRPDDEGDPALRALDWREVGPYRGGRSAAVIQSTIAPRSAWADRPCKVSIRARTGISRPWIFTVLAPPCSARPRVPAA